MVQYLEIGATSDSQEEEEEWREHRMPPIQGRVRPLVLVSVVLAVTLALASALSAGLHESARLATGAADVEARAMMQLNEVPGKIQWKALRAQLPFDKKDQGEKKRRAKLYKEWDNGNKVMSLAEADKGVRTSLELPAGFEPKKAIDRAHKLAKGKGGNKDYVEGREFRLFLESLYEGLQYQAGFNALDADGDGRLDAKEFKAGQAAFEKWAGTKVDPDKGFEAMDVNTGGHVLYEEFASYAKENGLHPSKKI